MTLPDSAELTQLRADLEAATLPDTCNVLSLTKTSDGAGGYTETWGTATASVACRLDSVNAQETTAAGALRPFHSFVLTVPYGTTITEANRVECNSQTFNVTSVDSEKSWSACVRAYLERV